MTMDQWLLVGIAGLAIVVVLLLGMLIGSRLGGRLGGRGRKLETLALPQGAEALAPAFSELRAQLGEVRGQMDEMRRFSATAEERRKQEDQAWDRLSRVETALPGIQQTLQGQIAEALRDLGKIKEQQAAAQQRWGTEDSAYESLERLNAVMLGSAKAGIAGENVVAKLLSPLPAQWRIIDHKVDGGKVEFAVQLPDGFILPVDSKIVAQQDLIELDAAKDQRQQTSLRNRIHDQVLKKAEEVQKYVDERSVGFAIMAITDAAYGVAGSALSEAYQKYHVLLVPFSLLAPFALMIYELHRHSGDIDAVRLARLLDDAQGRLAAAADIVSGHLSTAVTMVTNARDKLSGELAAATIALEQVRAADATAEAPPARRSA